MTDAGPGSPPCRFPGCGGILDAGYCDTCGRAPELVAPGAAPASAPAAPASPGAPVPPMPVGAGAPGHTAPPAPQADPLHDDQSGPVSSPLGGRGSRGSRGSWGRRRGSRSLDAAGHPGPSSSSSTGAGGLGGVGGVGAMTGSGRLSSPTYRLPASAPVDGSPCSFAGCGGTLEGGYCGVCGRAPAGADAAGGPATTTAGPGSLRLPSLPTLRPSALRVEGPDGPTGRHFARSDSGRTGSGRLGSGRTGSSRTGSGRSSSGRSSSRRTGGTRLGLGLVDVPAVRAGDPAEAVMAIAEVPEGKRFCSNCNQAVGRSRNDRPGRTEGFCPGCRAHFSFTPKLAAGDLVAGQYEVLGVLAHGGLGWIYLARDRAVSNRWVVLKGLLDATSEDAALAAVAERRFLAALDHPNVVKIYNFVMHGDAGYIVMEYVGGKSLKTLLKERRDANHGQIDPLPVDQAIAYALAVLPAMGYFHAQGLVYCDMKPDNVVLSGDSLKLIDLGGVRHLDEDEGAIYGTIGYQAPEVAEAGPSIVSDLYTVGRMLAVLVLDFKGYQGTYVDSLPPPDVHPLLAEHDSLHRFLLKATARDPVDRFASAEEMAEQLLGILREEAAAKGEVHPAVSRVFGPDGVVGVGAGDEVRPDWHLLPLPKVDPGDPGAGYLLGLAEGDPDTVVAGLTAALATRSVPASTEVLLRLARAQLDTGDVAAASATLDRIDDPHDWRLWWHRGLAALSQGAAADAVDWLDPVYTELPGEVPTKLALALAFEQTGDVARSADLYDIASRTDPSYVSGAFGLARVRAASGDRESAVSALGRVPAASSVHTAARIAAVRALASTAGVDPGSGGVEPPSAEQLERAGGILEQLQLEPRRHALLALELFEAGLVALACGVPPAGARILGRPMDEGALRDGLEATYRQLARHAATPRERVELVDRANRVRARSLL
jgi:serine/threonine-protein kinase PknG